jgi:amino acid adenylation domain-containing protein
VLKLDRVGVHDNFFELGGHSLLATRLMARIQDRCLTQLPISVVFVAPTVEKLAGEIESRQRLEIPAVHSTIQIIPDPASVEEPFPLTDIQQVYWIGRSSNFDLGNIAAHRYLEYDVPGLALERFQKALQKVIVRHGMLRAIFLPDGMQRILSEVPEYKIATRDLRALPNEALDVELKGIRQALSHQVIDVTRWPLFELRASLLAGDVVRLHASVDILIFDAWSFRLFVRDLWHYYQEDVPLPAVQLSFRDYVLAKGRSKESLAYKAAWEYWRPRLRDFSAPQFPLALSLSAIRSPRFERRHGRIDRSLWDSLKMRASRRSVTPSGALLAAFSELIAGFTGSSRFTLNLTVFNRSPLHPQINEVIGDFTSITLLEVDQSERSFELRANKLQKRLWQDIEHDAVSGVELLRELSRIHKGTVLMPVVFTSTLGLQTIDDRSHVQAAPLGKAVYGVSQTPQVILDHQVAEQEGALQFNWDFLAVAFPAGFIDAMFDQYCALLHRLATTDAAWGASSCGLVPPEQLSLFKQANETHVAVPEDTLHGAFLDRATKVPSLPAVITPSKTLTYVELEHRSAAICSQVQQHQIASNQLVAIVMDRGWEQVVAVLGILRAGAAYVPLDPSWPRSRLLQLMQEGEVKLILTQSWLENTIARPPQVAVIAVDLQEESTTGEFPSTTLAKPEHLAYVIYTSGSTGHPKGVMIDHRGALNTILDINRRFSVGEKDRCLAVSSLSFDLSVYDIFGPLTAGGCVLIPRYSPAPDPGNWLEFGRQHGVTIWNSVPALLDLIVEYSAGRPERSFPDLRLTLLSGDWIPVTLPKRLMAVAPHTKAVSLGGATEASIWSVVRPIDDVSPDWSSIPYGRPMANQGIHVLDGAMEPCPIWVAGELYISGVGLAVGYWRDPERTSKSFVIHPKTNERLYRTGDIGRWLPEGEIEFLGREDLQVKIQGHRIELGEIEAKLLEHPNIRHAVVSAVGERHKAKRLMACAVCAIEMSDAELRQFLMGVLPAYMIPTQFVFLPALPLTPNGKVDRKALPVLDVTAGELDFVATRSPLERMVARIWEDVLALDHQVGIHDNFFDLGGDSLLGTQVVVRLQQALNITLPLKVLFEFPTIASLMELGQRSNSESVATQLDQSRTAMKGVPPIDHEAGSVNKLSRVGTVNSGNARIELSSHDVNGDLRRLMERRNSRQFARAAVPLEDLARLLESLRSYQTEYSLTKYRYASAGGLYPVQTYLCVHDRPPPYRLEGLSCGTYRYDAFSHALISLATGVDLDANIHTMINRPVFNQAAFSLFLVCDMGKIAPTYESESLRFSCIEAGMMAQLLDQAAGGCEIGLCHTGGVNIQSCREKLHLDDQHVLLHAYVGGKRDDQELVKSARVQSREKPHADERTTFEFALRLLIEAKSEADLADRAVMLIGTKRDGFSDEGDRDQGIL